MLGPGAAEPGGRPQRRLRRLELALADAAQLLLARALAAQETGAGLAAGDGLVAADVGSGLALSLQAKDGGLVAGFLVGAVLVAPVAVRFHVAFGACECVLPTSMIGPPGGYCKLRFLDPSERRNL